MKKQIVLSILITVLSLSAYACDLCNLYLGLNPQYNRNQVGLRMRLRTAAGLHSHAHVENGFTHVHAAMVYDTYLSTEVFARIYLRPKWVMNISAPFVLNAQRDVQGNTKALQGLGDIPLLMQRQVFNFPSKDSTHIGQRLFAGLGLKVPLGTFDLGVNDDPHLQTVTGSRDGLFVTSYMVLWRKWALSVDANARVSTGIASVTASMPPRPSIARSPSTS